MMRLSPVALVKLKHCLTGAAVLLLFCTELWFHRSTTSSLGTALTHGPHLRDSASNETLGFEKILALSSRRGWRIQGIQAAAQLTGLQVDIPVLPRNPKEFISAFENLEEDLGSLKPPHGSATTWLSHLDMLKYVVFSQFQTALVLEDDVDWDLDIRHQMI
ncbi:hypothetical protein P152DRAFT_512692 [Eremomyces bilateralis CBS 781.70]|uniref:Glycosyltransferase family 25 protein n=1 Tax=Eremomyces bilateralis CBS 781.70 TaxID=1392243 RepID=A0A6G1G8S8_9PEZI|nr:uncharacterized protein P152DRAFT_512692 [Eremomyces bilateralis CBS 781.70]KAF1814300.1 hypothetical protein P152DRAFT_512692 [Eremomyces bilateralis CBS 781.70]